MSGYFDPTYFDPTYFDDGSGTTVGGHIKRRRGYFQIPIFDPSAHDDELALLLLEDT